MLALVSMPLEQRIGLHIKRTEQELIAAKTAALRPYGLTVPQYSALMFIAVQPGISAAALARECLVTPQTMATVLTNLDHKQLITRQPHPWHRNATRTRAHPQRPTTARPGRQDRQRNRAAHRRRLHPRRAHPADRNARPRLNPARRHSQRRSHRLHPTRIHRQHKAPDVAARPSYLDRTSGG